MTPSATKPYLIIGYGNELRSDDGIGPALARTLETVVPDNVEIFVSHQLLPEMALDIAERSLIIFIDAVENAGNAAILASEIEPEDGRIDTHALTPNRLMSLARNLYGQAGRCMLVGIPAYNLSHGTEISEQTKKYIPQAVDIVIKLLDEHQTN